MAANSSVPEDNRNLLQDSNKQVNGNASQKTDTTALPQRALRLNRRGFYLTNRDKQNQGEEIGKMNKSRHKTIVFDPNDSRIKSPPAAGQKVIKLSNSSKKSDLDSNHCQKRYSSDTSASDTDLNLHDMPPKKKHKLITWP